MLAQSGGRKKKKQVLQNKLHNYFSKQKYMQIFRPFQKEVIDSTVLLSNVQEN